MLDTAAWPRLLKDLRSTEIETRRSAIETLAATGEEVLPFLVPLLEDDDARLRYHAQRTLLTFGDAAAAGLSRAAESEQKPLRYLAVTTLARMNTQFAAAPLTRAVWDSDYLTRSLALLGLVHCGAPDLPALLQEMMRHPEPGYYLTALHFLPSLNTVHALTMLLDATRDNQDGRRAQALQILLDMSQDGGWPRKIVVDPQATLEQRYHLLEALFRAPTDIAKWAQYDNIVMRDLCSHLFGSHPFRSLREILRELEHDHDPHVSQSAKDLMAWRDLPRASDRNAQKGQLLRAGANTSPESLLRAGEEPDNTAASTFWQKLARRRKR
jgi:HEAT repeat protein